MGALQWVDGGRGRSGIECVQGLNTCARGHTEHTDRRGSQHCNAKGYHHAHGHFALILLAPTVATAPSVLSESNHHRTPKLVTESKILMGCRQQSSRPVTLHSSLLRETSEICENSTNLHRHKFPSSHEARAHKMRTLQVRAKRSPSYHARASTANAISCKQPRHRLTTFCGEYS